MAINFPEGTQDHPAGIVQVKMYSTNGATSRTSAGYFWGGGNGGASANNGRITFTPRSTSNRIIVTATLNFSNINVNGGVLCLINGAHDSTTRWIAEPSGAYVGSGSVNRQAWTTADDSWSVKHDYSIGSESVIMSTTSSYTLPSTIDIGFYWALNSGSSGYLYFNRQAQDNGGRAISSATIYEVKE